MFGRNRSSLTLPSPSEGEGAPVENVPPSADSTRLRQRIHNTAVLIIAAGNLGFGALATAAPSVVAPIIQENEESVRKIGLRDIGYGMALWSAKDRRLPLLLSIKTDAFEVMAWAREKPKIAAVPALWTVLAVIALLTHPKKAKR